MHTETEDMTYTRSEVVRPFARVVAHHISQDECEKHSIGENIEANFMTRTYLEPFA